MADKHYWKHKELVYLKECIVKHQDDRFRRKERTLRMFNAKYPNIEELDIKKAVYNHKDLFGDEKLFEEVKK